MKVVHDTSSVSLIFAQSSDYVLLMHGNAFKLS